jgi:hypothetical protein
MSGLLEIGSGALKVMAIDHVMHIPAQGLERTTNFMIGVTAGADRSQSFDRSTTLISDLDSYRDAFDRF